MSSLCPPSSCLPVPLKVRGSLARRALKELEQKGHIKLIDKHFNCVFTQERPRRKLELGTEVLGIVIGQ